MAWKDVQVFIGDNRETLKNIPDGSVYTCVTSPPYYGLRDYGTGEWVGGDPECPHRRTTKTNPETNITGHRNVDEMGGAGDDIYKNVCPQCGAVRVDKQIGLEETPQEYIDNLVQVFREVKRVLREDGTLWLNIGDTYATSTKTCGRNDTERLYGVEDHPLSHHNDKKISHGLKNKDLIGIPWRLAFALQQDGWYLRQDIIWCLSGGAWVYARTKRGDSPMMVKDVALLDPSTVKLWNGEKWTQLLGMSRSDRRGDEIEFVLRSGERISCTPTHKFPTNRGLLEASEIRLGDVFERCRLPEPESPRDCAIDEDAAWFAGVYLADGSMSGRTIQISGHVKKQERWKRLKYIAKKYGGHITRTINGNKMDIRLYGKVLIALLEELIVGKTAKNKGVSPNVWQYSNSFLESLLDGYLQSDGHWEESNKRYRLGFTRNYNLERDLRVICARLGYKLKLNTSFSKMGGKTFPSFRGEIRKETSGHFNEKSMEEVVEIRRARCRYVWDLGVEDEPHLFSLASGILTHNSKQNALPESVKDRCTKSHEYIFLLSKSEKYYFDYKAIREKSKTYGIDPRSDKGRFEYAGKGGVVEGEGREELVRDAQRSFVRVAPMRNKRSVWEVSTKSYQGHHFAVFPPDLIEPCVLAGCPKGGTVLDPFGGSGTTAGVAVKHGRKAIYCDLNEEFAELINQRIDSIVLGRNPKNNNEKSETLF